MVRSAEDSAADGVEHLQVAAREMLAAARSFLDAVEVVVGDRDKMSSVVSVVTDLFETAGASLASIGADRPRHANGTASGPAAGTATSQPGAGSRVRRVVVE